MPYPNFHSCRIREPNLFKKGSFKTLKTKTKGLTIIVGLLKSTDKSALQAYRYAKKDWDADRARKHCGKRGGSFEAASASRSLAFFSDHSFLHLIWSKVQKENWQGWSKEDVLSEHAKVTDILRKNGYAMTPKSDLDLESKKKEDTVRALSSASFSEIFHNEEKLEDQKMFTDISLIDEVEKTPNFVSLLQLDDSSLFKIHVLLSDRDEKLEKQILDQLPNDVKDKIQFEYSLNEPDSSYIPLFDLVLKPKKLEIFLLH